jgi:prepilin-type N-terminal cleavage/methylation domain-containing protein
MKRNVKGFTLIELLIVVVIIGILAAIAIPKFAATKERAYVASMKTDLKNLATAEEGYASANNGAYFSHPFTAPSDTTNGFSPSVGNTITATADAGPPTAWHALATSTQTTKQCAMHTGGTPGLAGTDTTSGAPYCTP